MTTPKPYEAPSAEPIETDGYPVEAAASIVPTSS
jgi:hypothetical protein